jgi:hypothetical protein
MHGAVDAAAFPVRAPIDRIGRAAFILKKLIATASVPPAGYSDVCSRGHGSPFSCYYQPIIDQNMPKQTRNSSRSA